MAESFQQITIKKRVSVEVGATLFVADSLPFEAFNALDYFLSFKKEGSNLTKAFKVLVRKTETNVEDSVYSRIGTGVDVDFFVDVNGSNVELTITNNEAESIELVFARTKL